MPHIHNANDIVEAIRRSQQATSARFDRRFDKLEMYMAQVVDDLKAAVAAERTVVESAVTLLNDLMDQLKAAASNGDLSAVNDIVNDVKSQTGALAAAIVKNTPSAPQAPSDPAPTPPVDAPAPTDTPVDSTPVVTG